MVQKKFDHSQIEKKWQKVWQENKTYQPDLQNAKKPFYNLMMFPYPSAEGLHVGNMYAFTGADVYGRFQRMQGHDVFEPIGLDGFGIHSENYALKIGKHPREQAKVSQENFYRQLHEIGNGFAWDNKLETYDPEYYKWTQWLFVQMFKNGLAYRGKAMVNWCPKDKTVLADEQVEAGVCERCKTPVERRPMEQWFFKITKYADRLLDNIEKINWPDKIKIAQRQWIGKKEGAEVEFSLVMIPGQEDGKHKVKVFTTRLDTIFGVSFLTISPELANKWLSVGWKASGGVKKYVDQALHKTSQERLAGAGDKTGVFTEVFAVNPVNNEKVPVWVADYVLGDVGTGAVMGVPAHDERDFEFAKKHKLPIRAVVIPTFDKNSSNTHKLDFMLELEHIRQTDNKGVIIGSTWIEDLLRGKNIENNFVELVVEDNEVEWWENKLEVLGFKKDKKSKSSRYRSTFANKDNSILIGIDTYNKQEVLVRLDKEVKKIDGRIYEDFKVSVSKGILLFSGKYSGLTSEEAIQKIATDFVASIKITNNYHLRDWLISRQRYWGPPIPMINCEKCGWNPVSESELPVLLPELSDWQPKGDGRGPLENAPEGWLYTKCPKCGERAKRETDVSDTFLDSSWYFLRYPSVNVSRHAELGSASEENKTLKQVQGDEDLPWDNEITKKWLPVHAYIGGAEHAVLHLLYSRFVWMTLKDWGFITNVDSDEPFPFLFSHGLIVKDGAKMSKSRGNVVIPDEYIRKFGADTLRMYLMFLGPYNQGGDFRDTGILGMRKFLERVWNLLHDEKKVTNKTTKDTEIKLHKTIKDIKEDVGKFQYNTAIARFMELTNILKQENETISKEDALKMIKLIAPIAPHMTEELFQTVTTYESRVASKEFKSIHLEKWPDYDEKLLVQDTVVIVVQINGKIRASVSVNSKKSIVKEEIVEMVKQTEKVKQYLAGKEIKKEIFIPGKLVNFVI